MERKTLKNKTCSPFRNLRWRGPLGIDGLMLMLPFIKWSWICLLLGLIFLISIAHTDQPVSLYSMIEAFSFSSLESQVFKRLWSDSTDRLVLCCLRATISPELYSAWKPFLSPVLVATFNQLWVYIKSMLLYLQ